MIRCIIFILSFCCGLQAKAFTWQDLWATPNQQGQALMQAGKYDKAREKFANPDWAASASYRQGKYDEAAQLFKLGQSQPAYYNLGNTLAHLGQYKEAIQAYDKALAINPKDEDAVFNRKLIQDLMKKNKQQNKNKQKQQDKNKQDKDQQNQQQQNTQDPNQQDKPEDKDKQDKQDQNQEKQDKQDQNKPDQSKQDKDQQAADAKSQADREKQQAKQQWLRLIPDDPGGLLRQKFLRDHLRRERGWYQ